MSEKLSSDKRFSSSEWLESNPFASVAALYAINSETMKHLTDNLIVDNKEKKKIKFLVEQWIESISPSNFLATNPEAQKLIFDTKGESFFNGLENLVQDFHKGKISQTDESAFEIGKDLATTTGSVIYENEIVQLIQYKPTTKTVSSTPFLIIPPCINKFYIMDLQPKSSFVKFALDSGNSVFLVSWKMLEKMNLICFGMTTLKGALLIALMLFYLYQTKESKYTWFVSEVHYWLRQFLFFREEEKTELIV